MYSWLYFAALFTCYKNAIDLLLKINLENFAGIHRHLFIRKFYTQRCFKWVGLSISGCSSMKIASAQEIIQLQLLNVRDYQQSICTRDQTEINFKHKLFIPLGTLRTF